MMFRTRVINFILIVISIFGESLGIIYQLNDTEYKKLPVIYELEDYDSCMQDPAAIYCVASLELYGERDNEIYTLMQEYSQHKLKHYNYSLIERGVCVTKSCMKYGTNITLNIDNDLKMVLEKCLNDRFQEKYNLSTRLNRLSCDRHTEVNEKDILDYIVATVIILLCTAVAVGSWYDMKFSVNKEDGKIGKGGQFLQSFSIARNIEKLTRDGDERLDDLKGLHGIRTIGQIIVIGGHSISMLCLFGDAHKYEKEYESPLSKIIFCSANIVQIFFLMSGFLLAYLLEMHAEKAPVTWRSVPKIIFLRWWRLTPPIAFVLALIVTWFRYLGSGPLWKFFVTTGSSAQCRHYFWTHLLFINNFFVENICSYQSWHIAADMQLFILCLIVHFAIRNRSLKFKICALSFLLLIGIAGPIGHVWLQDLDSSVILTPQIYRTLQEDIFKKYHVLPHNNISVFVIGMAAGYFGYYCKQKKMEFPNFMIGSILCWLAIPMLLGVFYTASLFLIDVEKSSLFLRILYASCHRVVIGLIGSIWILGSILKFNGCSKALMEWRLWVVPSKLSYGVYLIHTELIYYLLGSRTQLLPHSVPNLMFMYAGLVVVSNALALVVYLLIEAPSNQVINIFMGETSSKHEKKKD